MKIGVVGVGYVGLVTGTGFAEMGNDVICVDIDQKKIENLNQGIMPIYEPGLKELVLSNLKKKRLSFDTDVKRAISSCDVLVIAVGTPSGEDGSADLQYVLSVAKEIGRYMDAFKTVIVKSTVPVGSNKKVRDSIQECLEERSSDLKFDIVSNPEFLKEGSAVEDFLRPDRIVVGCESGASRELMERLYAPFVRNGHPIVFMDIVSSELTKYAANAMLATKISFMNEISRFCEKVGANVSDIRRGIGSDPRIGMDFLYAGLGYGGSCFPKDVKALIQSGLQMQSPMGILESVESANLAQREYFLEKILKHYNGDVGGKTFAVWGLAFKPGTDDMREAPSLHIIEGLAEKGASFVGFDPVASRNAGASLSDHVAIRFVDDPYEALTGSDALIICTEWREFREPDFEKMGSLLKKRILFDGRNVYDPKTLKKFDFEYISIGRPAL